jgi:regulatory protein
MTKKRGGRGRIEVHLDGEPAFDLAPTLALRLTVGEALDEAAIAALLDEDGRLRAWNLALGCVARRPRSRREVDRYLAGKEVIAAHREAALDRLAAAGYLDDTAFARGFIEQRDRSRPRGARALRAELAQKGVARAAVDAALADTAPDELDAAIRAGRKHLGHLRDVTDPQVFRNRLGAFLGRRGFGWETIRTAVERLRAERDAGD